MIWITLESNMSADQIEKYSGVLLDYIEKTFGKLIYNLENTYNVPNLTKNMRNSEEVSKASNAYCFHLLC